MDWLEERLTETRLNEWGAFFRIKAVEEEKARKKAEAEAKLKG